MVPCQALEACHYLLYCSCYAESAVIRGCSKRGNVACPAAVIAKVIGVDLGAQKVSLGLKPSYFEGEDSEGEGTDVDADQTDKDVDEEAFEAAAGLDSSDEDMELGEKLPAYSRLFTKRPAHLANELHEGLASAQRACLCVLCHSESNCSCCSCIVIQRTDRLNGESMISWVQARASMTWSKTQHSTKACGIRRMGMRTRMRTTGMPMIAMVLGGLRREQPCQPRQSQVPAICLAKHHVPSSHSRHNASSRLHLIRR